MCWKQILTTIRLMTVKLVRLPLLTFAPDRSRRAGGSTGLPPGVRLSLRFQATQPLLEHGQNPHHFAIISGVFGQVFVHQLLNEVGSDDSPLRAGKS